MSRYDKVTEPIRIGSLKLKNRIVMSPMSPMYTGEKGFVTDKLAAYYARRAKGGVAMVVGEHTGISEAGRGADRMLMLSSDEYKEGFKKLIDGIHEGGAAFAAELNYAGRSVDPADVTEADMEQIAADWAAAAVRARDCGADAVIVHMCNGYLLSRFLSPRINKRTDAYGGSVENRARFPQMVLRKVRETMGPDYPIYIRHTLTEDIEGGFTLDDSIRTAKMMVEIGIDAIDVTAGAVDSVYRIHPTFYSPDAINMEEAKEFRAHFDLPILCGSRIRSLDAAQKALEEGCCDIVTIGRPLIADPDLVNKSLEGKEADITPCLSCNNCNKTSRLGCLHCSVNPEAGHELDLFEGKSASPKKVLVIGGGIAGMKAAEVCAKAGHEVVLAEKSGVLGGHVIHAGRPPMKSQMRDFLRVSIERVKNSGARIEMNKEIDSAALAEIAPDVVVLAAGATPRIPTFIPGLDTMTNVLSFEEVLTGLEADRTKVGEKVLVLGGGSVGCEMADFLGEAGCRVTIVEMAPAIIQDASAHFQHDLGGRLKAQGAKVYTDTKVVGFDHNAVVVADKDGKEFRLEGYDNVVLSMGLVSTTPKMMEILEGKVPKIIPVGDSNRPRGIADALEEALMVPAQIG